MLTTLSNESEIIFVQVQKNEEFTKNLEARLSSNPIWDELNAVKNSEDLLFANDFFHFAQIKKLFDV